MNKQKKRSKPRRARRKDDAVGQYFGDAWSLAKRTAAGLNEIRKLINVEQKWSETSGTHTPDRSGSVTYLSGISQGDDVVQRDGNSIKIQHFRMKFFVGVNSSNTPGCAIRVLVVRDLQNQGAIITADDVLQNVGAASAPLAFKDFVNGPLQNKRFTFVYDRLFTVDQYNPLFSVDFETSHDCHTYYRGSGSTVASAGNGSYFLITVSSEPTDVPTVIFNTRLEFTDN